MASLAMEDVYDFQRLVGEFSKKSLYTFIDECNPDGNLFILPNLLLEATNMGIVPAACPDAAGYEYGVWGSQTIDSEIALINSLSILSELASVCATFAFLVHIQGLATNLLLRLNIQMDKLFPFLSLYDGVFPPEYDRLSDSSSIAMNSIIEDSYAGTVAMGYGWKPEYAVVCIPYDSGWHALYFDAVDTVIFCPLRTHGLRGAIASARFNSKIAHRISLKPGIMQTVLAFFWLGIAAISVGVARGAYDKAIAYAKQRYQRGGLIKDIEAVHMLLGTSRAKIESVWNALVSHFSLKLDSLLHHAAIMKYMASTLCAEAVSDCLQVFGGYGYMEDFGMEKKFRDINTLVNIGGSPFFMKRFIANMTKED
jgi:hypothetical protein